VQGVLPTVYRIHISIPILLGIGQSGKYVKEEEVEEEEEDSCLYQSCLLIVLMSAKSIYLSIYVSTALRTLAVFQFLNPIHSE
jgi:hypothetical protein